MGGLQNHVVAMNDFVLTFLLCLQEAVAILGMSELIT